MMLLLPGLVGQQTVLAAQPLADCHQKPAHSMHYDDVRKCLLYREVYYLGGFTLYCAKAFTTPTHKNNASWRNPTGIDADHILPQSRLAKAAGCDKVAGCKAPAFRIMAADLHNLYPALAVVNRTRRNRGFAEIEGNQPYWDSCNVEMSDNSIEPRPEARGNIARAILYMADQYDIALTVEERHLMLSWHQADPPGPEEFRRNKKILALQKRNNHWISP